MWRNQDFFRELLDNLYDGVYFVDRNMVITYWNKGAERMSGFTADEMVGTGCKDNILKHIDHTGHRLCLDGCPLSAAMEDGKERQAEVYMHHRDGHRVPVLVRVAPIRDNSGQTIGAVEIFSDNSARIADLQKIEELRHLALLDSLTSLANRRYLEITLRSGLEELERYGWAFGILFIDVDNFKSVNDSYGHETGDEVLKMIAKSMTNCCRVFDTVGRWGGEEFVAIIMNVGKEDFRITAERFRQVIEHSTLTVGKDQIRVTVSIGATDAVPGDTIASLLQRADTLMYLSKQAGRNCVSFDR
jgi:diguanylate cyclase (GGDEF)-like protein/PAS domain S-box-containing protein